MTLRRHAGLLALAILVAAPCAGAQGLSLSVGAAAPGADLSKTGGAGIDAQFGLLTDPRIGPFALRIDIGYDHLSGKNGITATDLSSQTIGLQLPIGTDNYVSAAPGLYQSGVKTQIAGHNVIEQSSYFSAQLLVGRSFDLWRWRGRVEFGAVRLFSPGRTLLLFPLRMGVSGINLHI